MVLPAGCKPVEGSPGFLLGSIPSLASFGTATSFFREAARFLQGPVTLVGLHHRPPGYREGRITGFIGEQGGADLLRWP